MNTSAHFGLVRTILNTTWNPFGISMSPEDDEYDDYVRVILSRKWTEKELNSYLSYTTDVTLGMGLSDGQKKSINQTVVELAPHLRKIGMMQS